MSIRISVVVLFVVVLCLYAWKDWFKSLCGLFLMTAIISDKDLPSAMFGIQGMNLWNVLLAGVLLAWLATRSRQGLTLDMPRPIAVLLLLYLGVILFGVLRAVFDRSYIENYPLQNLISEEMINTIKWTLPGLMLYDGCRTRRHVILAVTVICGLYLLIALQVVYRVPWECALSDPGVRLVLRRGKGCARIGYNPCDISAFLAGASWGVLAALALAREKRHKLLLLAAAAIMAFGQALTGGRAGYLAWAATGVIMCLVKWRKYLLLGPVIAVLLPAVFPGVAARMLQGFGQVGASGETTVDTHTVTSGRAQIWPHVIDGIRESPLVGHGRLAMKRTGLTNWLWTTLGESFPHPHNMYLETFLDNGIVGSLPIFLFWGSMLIYSGRMFLDSNRLYAAVGGLALSMMLAQLFSGIGAQHFYPVDSTVGVWAAMFLILRVHVEEMKIRGTLSIAAGWE